MIVKNESKIITRLLESVLPYIDSYCICDTGSTDETPEVIETFFCSQTPPIPGTIVYEPFRDFEYNRSFALKACEGRDLCDYVLLLDADMIFWTSLSSKELHDLLERSERDYYFIMQGSPTFFYKNVRVVRNNCGICYKGVTHEYVCVPDGFSSHLLDPRKVFIKDIGDGGCKHDKYERDIRLLTKGLEEKPDDQRYTFYLANSYYCIQKYDEAIPLYLKRSQLGGFGEEIWYSLFRMGECYRHKGDTANAVYWYLNAYQCSDYRVENLYEVVKLYREKGDNRLAKLYYDVAKRICEEKRHDEHLFLQRDIYDFRLDYEKSVFGFYFSETEIPRRDLRKISMKLMNEPNFEPWFRGNVLSNYKFYSLALRNEYCVLHNKTQSPVLEAGLARFRSLAASIEEIVSNADIRTWVGDMFIDATPFWNSTPSLLAVDDGWICNFRFVNYYIGDKGEYINQRKIQTVNVIVKFDAYGKWIRESVVALEHDPLLDGVYVGLEDIRLFSASYLRRLSTAASASTANAVEGMVRIQIEGIVDSEDEEDEENKTNNAKHIIMYNCNRGLEESGLNMNQQRIAVECGQIQYQFPDKTEGNFTNYETSKMLNKTKTGAFARTAYSGLVWKEGGMMPVEKNWVLLPTIQSTATPKTEVCEKMVYGWHPMVVGDYTNRVTGMADFQHLYRNMTQYPTPQIFSYFRGSTNGIIVGNEVWCLCHVVSYEDRRFYYHTIVALEAETFKPLRFTEFFTFERENVEYCLGMTLETVVYDFGEGNKKIKEKYLLFGYSTMDRATKTTMISKKAIENLFIEI